MASRTTLLVSQPFPVCDTSLCLVLPSGRAVLLQRTGSYRVAEATLCRWGLEAGGS